MVLQHLKGRRFSCRSRLITSHCCNNDFGDFWKFHFQSRDRENTETSRESSPTGMDTSDRKGLQRAEGGSCRRQQGRAKGKMSMKFTLTTFPCSEELTAFVQKQTRKY